MEIVFLDHHTLNADGMSIEALKTLGNVTLYPRTRPDQVLERCDQADVIISNKVKIQKMHIEKLHKLKYIVVAATGFNNIDIMAAAEKEIPVSNVRGYSTESVVQHTFALIFGLLNKVERYGHQVSNGEWQKCEDFSYYHHSIREVKGKTLGIIGYGNIGKRVGEVATAFGMKVLAFSRRLEDTGNPEHLAVDMNTLLSTSDIITCHAPLNKDSRHIINTGTIEKMKSSCILINTARGGLIQDEDLASALQKGRIAGAGIDTLAEEPPRENSLIGAPNCLITPHQAWTSLEARQQLLEGIIQNIKGFQSGKLQNVVNQD